MKEKNKRNEVSIVSSDKNTSNKNNRIRTDLPKIIPNVNRVADFLQFAQWMAIPQVSRKQKTQKDFANEIDVDEDTLTNWKRNPNFYPIVQQFTDEWMKERRSDVIDALYQNACREGKAKDVLTFLKLSGISDNFNENVKN